MNDYINQFYNEGLATAFHLKPINFIKKRIKNKKISNFLTMLVTVVYTILAVIFAIYVFISKYPL